MGRVNNMEEVAVNNLRPYERNAKLHPRDQINKLKRSIEEFGFLSPCLIDHDGNIIAGHGRIEAAKELGLETVPCVYVEGLTDEQRRAYILADNRLTELGGWDMTLVEEELDALTQAGIDATITGFDWDAATTIEPIEDEYDPEQNAETIEPRVIRGDVWKLGDHRLMCGDATIAEDVAALMDGERVDVCFTSPPYNMAAGGKWESVPRIAMKAGHAYNEYEDSASDGDYSCLLINAARNALEVADDVMFNIGILEGSKKGIVDLLADLESHFLDVVVWNKSASMPHGMESQKGMLSHRCELIFCFNQKGNRSFSHPRWDKGAGINRIDTGNASGNKYAQEHAATFPVEFAFEVINKFTDESVLDIFGGTGTTMIAAEQLGRRCYMMELDPHYCDVIIDRWEEFTGRKAEKVN